MSFGELLVLVIIAVLALGTGRLPAAGTIVGKGLRNFHRGLREARDVLADDSDASPAVKSRPSSRLID